MAKQVSADCLKVGDVIWWDQRRAVVIESSDQVETAPPDAIFGGTPAHRCCEPRIAFLGPTGRMTHQTTHLIVPNARKFTVAYFLDTEIPSAIPEEIDG